MARHGNERAHMCTPTPRTQTNKYLPTLAWLSIRSAQHSTRQDDTVPEDNRTRRPERKKESALEDGQVPRQKERPDPSLEKE
mmetsp:Transcript_53389/g.134420  ORF Transcript_53389/g.134420 Transcript_53389/m.134420 type:complete len:82 (-) Transcript_53389:221-466(-)